MTCGHSRRTGFAAVFPILNACVATVTAGWCPTAARAYWGKHGAAGLLLRAPRPDGSAAVLLQHRAPWSHQGGTWGLPGGARDSHETAEQAAVREAHEEAGLLADLLTVRTTVVTAESASGGRHWTYTTVIADAAELLETVPNRESCGAALGRRGRRRRAAAASRVRRQLGAAARRWRRLSRCCKPSFEPLRPRPAGRRRAVIARTTTMRRAPAVEHLGQPLLVDAADREPRLVRAQFGGGPDQVEAGRRPARFGRGRPARADAEVVDLLRPPRRAPARGRGWTGRSAGAGR